MLLSLGLGETSYIPDALVGIAQDQVDLDLLAFLQCYGRDLLEWETMLFFIAHRGWCAPETLAAEIEEPVEVVARKLQELTDRKLVEERLLVTGPVYRLTEGRTLRRAVARLGKELLWPTATVS
jgi:hypothetical protein